MRLSIKTCTLDMPFEAMLDFCVAQGVQAVEIGHRQLVRRAPHRLGRAAWLRNGPAALDGTSFAAGISPCAP